MKRALVGAAGALALLSHIAAAQDVLPWKDANPLERAEPRQRERRAQAAPPEKPVEGAQAPAATSDVPLPEARPDAGPTPPEAAEAAGPASGGTPAKPEERPENPAADPVPGEAPAPADAPADPTAAADLPVTDIPVPDERPQPTPGETGASDAPDRVVAPPSAGDGSVAEPVQPAAGEGATPSQDAPNAPEKLKAREPSVTPAATVEAAAAVEDSVACEAELKARGADFTVEETISEGACGVLRPLALKRLSSGIEVSPKTQMLCRTALALDTWMTKSVVPAAKADSPGDRLTEFRHASTYVCRPRASESGISEHARGSAIDIGSFVFASGREISIATKDAGSADARFLGAVRTGACGPFKTVLGPGTDSDHDTHFHLDIAARSNDATYCK
ncbi:hypothetical protein ASG43_13405 [Aureimonas sp. Leaf454]|uniref:extensin family protein n=1 Tax=Aureimonas sp. Leaf454 TaxID=1736381 RepID=UPI0006F645F2|nr:extensin family protein [Aureimonas sp. Leaf454]KQT44352.1 hypothetical protein ASG43_13405 [Aureimonas sp. Leaf454]